MYISVALHVILCWWCRLLKVILLKEVDCLYEEVMACEHFLSEKDPLVISGFPSPRASDAELCWDFMLIWVRCWTNNWTNSHYIAAEFYYHSWWWPGNIGCGARTSSGKILVASNQAHINGLVQERCNSSANALELRLSCTNPSIYTLKSVGTRGHHDSRNLWPFKCWSCIMNRNQLLSSLCFPGTMLTTKSLRHFWIPMFSASQMRILKLLKSCENFRVIHVKCL